MMSEASDHILYCNGERRLKFEKSQGKRVLIELIHGIAAILDKDFFDKKKRSFLSIHDIATDVSKGIRCSKFFT